jgi:gliding motility-associated-like protein
VDPNLNPQTDSYTYDEPGSYLLLQVLGNTADPIDTLRIEVLPPTRPVFRLYNCINNRVFVDFANDTTYDQLAIDYGDGNLETVNVSDQNSIHAYAGQGAYTISVQGLFENGDAVNCGVYDSTFNTVETLDIAQLEIVRVEDRQEIELAYTLNDPDVSYQLWVAENGSNTFDFARIDLDGGSSVFRWQDDRIDTDSNYYCFQIVALNRCDPAGNQFSNTGCSISVQGEAGDLQNQLEWQTRGFTDFALSRDEQSLLNLQQSAYIDSAVLCRQSYRYLVSAQQDGLRSISNSLELIANSTAIPPSPVAPTARISGRSAQLNWPEAPEAIRYRIYRSVDGGAEVLYDSLLSSSSVNYAYTDDDELQVETEYCYRLSYVDECINESELSEAVCVVVPVQARIFFPNAFTPDGDGLNDIFVYEASLLESVSFKVYNRWGEVIFTTEELGNGWDGRYRNAPAPQGVYIYEFRARDILGNVLTRRGSFNLIGGVRN